MRNHRLARLLLCLVFCVGVIAGCQVFQGERPLTVLVRDAETKKPIQTAEVYLCQRLKHDEVAPCRSRDLTQKDGIARLRPEPAGQLGFQLQAVAPDYLTEKVNVSADAFKKHPSTPAIQPDTTHLADVVVEVFHEPNFTVELVLPPGYRGLVKAEVQLQDHLSLSPQQRCFRFAVAPSGEVLVKGPALLQRVPVPEYRARYANGPLLNTTMDSKTIGFRWIKSAGNRHYFTVGTQLDYEVLHRRVAPEETRTVQGSWDDASGIGKSHKFKYSHITGK